MTVPGDEWAWAHEEAQDAPPVAGFEHVTAILVAHNGQEWLPATLRAIAGLDQRPGRLIAIDAASKDGTAELLKQAFTEGVLARGALVSGVIDELRETEASGFTQVVNDAVAGLPGDDDGWIWLLHDDSAPGSGCLTEMLRVATSPSPERGPAVIVPKLLRPKLRHRPD